MELLEHGPPALDGCTAGRPQHPKGLCLAVSILGHLDPLVGQTYIGE
jgi:hypothetical protein